MLTFAYIMDKNYDDIEHDSQNEEFELEQVLRPKLFFTAPLVTILVEATDSRKPKMFQNTICLKNFDTWEILEYLESTDLGMRNPIFTSKLSVLSV